MALQNWEQSFRFLVQQSRTLLPYPEQYRDAAHQVHGCEAKVWLALELAADGRVQLWVDSESRIVRGLLAVLQQAAHQKPASELAKQNLWQVYQAQGLPQHLSPSRIKGLQAVINELQRQLQQASP